jgi:hypothetical protein
MGNGKSVETNVNTQTELIQQIYAIASELSETYTNKYLDPKFCTTLALVYNDRLMNYRKQDLLGVSTTLGLAVDQPALKQQVCDSIVKHYTDRLNLIAIIQRSTTYCSDRVYALSSGPICTGNPEIFDEAACKKSGGRWDPYVVKPDQKIPENQQWYNYLDHMQDMYIKSMSRMYDILRQLKDFDQDITDERLKTISDEVKGLISNMTATCSQMYKLALTTPTFTKEELRMKQEDVKTSQDEAAARSAALRAAKGLEPVQAGGKAKGKGKRTPKGKGKGVAVAPKPKSKGT